MYRPEPDIIGRYALIVDTVPNSVESSPKALTVEVAIIAPADAVAFQQLQNRSHSAAAQNGRVMQETENGCVPMLLACRLERSLQPHHFPLKDLFISGGRIMGIIEPSSGSA